MTRSAYRMKPCHIGLRAVRRDGLDPANRSNATFPCRHRGSRPAAHLRHVRPSRNRLMPTSVELAEAQVSRRISTRSTVSMSECRWRTRMPCLEVYVGFSAVRLGQRRRPARDRRAQCAPAPRRAGRSTCVRARHFHARVDQAGPDARPTRRCCRPISRSLVRTRVAETNTVRCSLLPFVEAQRPVVQRGRQAEAELDGDLLAPNGRPCTSRRAEESSRATRRRRARRPAAGSRTASAAARQAHDPVR